MSNICCLFDACTVINLIHIDEDDFLIKKIDKLDFHLIETVFLEIRQNVYERLYNQNISKYSDRKELNKNKKIIDQKLSFFRGKSFDNNDLLKDLGIDYFNKVKKITDYNKKANGELCSTAYALYLSRYCEKKVFFYTDDFPAKNHFSFFFNYQQIGHIKDSVDLLILLYWLDEKFTENQFKNILSELHSQYATDATLLKQNLQNFHNSSIDAKYIKSKKEIVEQLKKLIIKLQRLDFKNISFYRDYFENKKSKCKEINDIISRFSSVFELENHESESDLLAKIRYIKDKIEDRPIYRLDDLLAL